MSSSDPRNHVLWTTIARQLENGGDEIAICGGDRAISYARLAAASEVGGRELDERFARGARIVIALRDQLDAAVALSAVLRSRATALLADPTSAERLRGLAAEWQVAGAVVEPGLLEPDRQPTLDGRDTARWLKQAGESPRTFELPAVAADDPAFWTFTSGTTGEPRAVVHAHRAPPAAYRAFADGVLHLGPEDVTISTAGLPFVYALGNNFFFPLMAGGTAILPADLLLPTVLGELARHGATTLVAGPWSLAAIARLAHRRRWVEAIRRLRCVLSAGEPLPASVFVDWRQRFGKEILDNLGCTEMFNSFVSNVPGDAHAGSLGRVVPGFELRIAGEPANPAARGGLSVRGDSRAIAVGAAGELSPPPGEWCDTGDEVEVDAGGRIVFRGRRDDRFKVKGRFLHPLEVERCLSEVAGVAECLVVPERDPSGLTIAVALVVPAGGASAEELTRRLPRHARERLEPFAVPARIELVSTLPRNERGKLLRPRTHGTL